MSRAAAAAAIAVLAALTGCARDAQTRHGGVAVGEAVTVYSLLPQEGPRAGAARDIVLGEKLALFEAGGLAGAKKVTFVSRALPTSRRAIADTVRDAIRDPQIIAAIADIDSATARLSTPLLNEAGILHLSPGATYTGLVAPVPTIDPDAPERYSPAGRASFVPLLPTDAALAVAIGQAARGRVAIEAEPSDEATALAEAIGRQTRATTDTAAADTVVYVGEDPENALGVIEAVLRENRRARVLVNAALAGTGLLEALDSRRVAIVTAAGPADQDAAFQRSFEDRFGRRPGPFALVGYRAMQGVLAALRRAGEDAGVRRRTIDAYFATDPLRTTASQPFFLQTLRGYEPIH